MSTLILITTAVFIALGVMYYLVKKADKKEKIKRGEHIAKELETMREKEKESHLGKGLFYRIKSGLFREKP